jgi:hypothetical protein
MGLDAIIEDIETASAVKIDSSQRSIPELKGRKRELEMLKSSFSSLPSNGSTSNSSKIDEEIEIQVQAIGEAILLYNYAEKAARKIQKTFRDKKQLKPDIKQGSTDATSENESEGNEKGVDEDTVEQEDSSRWFTLIFLALATAILVLPKILMSCWSVLQKCLGDDTGGADAVANTTMPQGGGGGGGGGAPAPTGGEAAGAQAGAQGAMAAQAAGSAASGAASGVAAGAAAGAAASATAAAAAAGATAAAAGVTQVVTVVVVSTAAVAATAAGVSVAASIPPAPILSTCGLATPDLRNGRVSMFFEGIPRPFDPRESLLVENLILESYNEITLGDNIAANGCLDPLSREMQDVTLVNQTFTPIGDGIENPVLEVEFEAIVSCDKCSTSLPLFGLDQVEDEEEVEPGKEVPERHRLLQDFDFDSQAFFQKLIQLVIFETEELSEIGELPEGFLEISKALVITDDDEEVLVTEVKYEKSSDRTTIEFGYVDENGEMNKETLVFTANGEGVPTSPFPTFQPSLAPTGLPSIEPTNVASESPSARPTIQPSESPTLYPSAAPSTSPSGSPSESPSFAPSKSPSAVPSLPPSESPSFAPSKSPSALPSFAPSESPSAVPSVSPSALPSFVPSKSPSAVPSVSPSESPSSVPSKSPSALPSSAPSKSPSVVPSVSPSESPSSVPSKSPSALPSFAPSESPSAVPSIGEW